MIGRRINGVCRPTQATIHNMKTMMELLIRLEQLRRCGERTKNNKQLTDGEKSTLRFIKHLVRDCLPTDVLSHYDRLMETESELRESAEVLAMAVLVSTWRDLSPAGRRRLETHFATPSRGRRTGLRANSRLVVPGSFSPRRGTRRVQSRGKSLQS